MIKEMPNIDNMKIIALLHDNTEHVFYLTGSRFFNQLYRKSSDYDFFAKDSIEIGTFLSGLGFKPLRNNDYLDHNTIIVYQYSQIHVQLVDDVAAKYVAQKILKLTPEKVDKTIYSRRSITMHWNEAFEAAKEIIDFFQH